MAHDSGGPLTIGVGSGWAGSAVIGGWLLGGVGFHGLFYLSVALALTAGMITWGYQRALRQSMPVSTIGAAGTRTLNCISERLVADNAEPLLGSRVQ